MNNPTCPDCGQPLHRVYISNRYKTWACTCETYPPRRLTLAEEEAERKRKIDEEYYWAGFEMRRKR